MKNKSSGKRIKENRMKYRNWIKQNEMKYCFTNSLDNDDLNVKYGLFFS